MAKYEWSEVFTSIEGEAKYSGHPTTYIRFTKCNFECRNFNNPEGVDTTSHEVLGFDPKDFKDIYTIPLITKGCDSIYSWGKDFAHMWSQGDENELGRAVKDVLPGGSFAYPSGKTVILSLTGGEPTLRAKTIPTLLESPAFASCNHVLIETNCAVPLSNEFVMWINQWLNQRPDRKWTWSNSPKLSASGEKWADTIRPDIATKQQWVSGEDADGVAEQYFKFVCGPSDAEFDEVAKAMNEYYEAGISRNVPVYIMPTSCVVEQQQDISTKVAAMCIERGYIYCHRIHLDVFGNAVGT